MQSGCAYINFGADGSLLFTDKEGLGLNASFFKGRPCKNGQYLVDPGFNLFAGFERDLSKLLSLSVIPIGDILGTLVATGTLVVAGKWLALKERFVRWRLYVEFYKSRDVDFRFGALKQMLQGSGPGSELRVTLDWIREDIMHRQMLMGATEEDVTTPYAFGAPQNSLTNICGFGAKLLTPL